MDSNLSALDQNHTCGCKACQEIPNAMVKNLAVAEESKVHSCTCQACKDNTLKILNKEKGAVIRDDHTCNCEACDNNQRVLMLENNK